MGEMISQVLGQMGFINVHMAVEWVGGVDRMIPGGTAFTFGINNGVLAVYDEKGEPWVAPRQFGQKFLDHYSYSKNLLKRGAYVPHSNDGGEWIHNAFPPQAFEDK